MTYRLNNLARVAVLGAVVSLAACEHSADLLGPPLTGGSTFKSYVAIGNSITAGFQSNGINDSTQRQSFAALLARSMGTRFAYPKIAGLGCPPPIANGLTGALLGNAPAATCGLRDTATVTDILNNVAVPGARAFDPISRSAPASNILTTLVLGGKTQVERALEAQPTFATVWIGNNDVLVAGLTGLLTPTAGVSPGIVSTPAQFQSNYDSLTSQLVGGSPAGLRGVLIAVAKVQYLPSLVSGALIAGSPVAQATISAAAGKAVTVHPNCTGSGSLINVPQLVQQIRIYDPATGAGHPPVISCEKGAFPAPVGDIFVLDSQEQLTLNATIDAYNAIISAKAAAIGFAYYDPNVLFKAQRDAGAIPPFPNFASTSATYGPLISLDGVHPSGAGHRLIANELIGVINAKYGTSLAPVS
jgi:lysophospholipase L1-like esterase